MKNTQVKHTPTPWEAIEEGYTINRDVFITSQGKPIFSLKNWPYAETDELINAQFIVKAVNSHDELVEALKMALLEQVEDMGRKTLTHIKIEQALKKAGE